MPGAPDPKSGVSTNSTTPAFHQYSEPGTHTLEVLIGDYNLQTLLGTAQSGTQLGVSPKLCYTKKDYYGG